MSQKMFPPDESDEEIPLEVIYFSKNLRAARIEANLSQRDLGKIAGISQGVLSEYERALRVTRITTMAKLAKAVNVPLWQLLRPC